MRHGIGADDGGRTGAVVDHDLLAQPRGDGLGHGARHHVGAAAGGIGHDPADRLRRPVVGACGGAGGEQGGKQGSGRQCGEGGAEVAKGAHRLSPC